MKELKLLMIKKKGEKRNIISKIKLYLETTSASRGNKNPE